MCSPVSVSILPQEIKPVRGADVYLVINGHLRMRTKTTRNRTTCILMRSIDTELTNDSRTRIELVYSFALRQGMTLHVTEIPSSYHLGGFTTALKPARMKALFAYGKRCARERRVWDDALAVLLDLGLAAIERPARRKAEPEDGALGVHGPPFRLPDRGPQEAGAQLPHLVRHPPPQDRAPPPFSPALRGLRGDRARGVQRLSVGDDATDEADLLGLDRGDRSR